MKIAAGAWGVRAHIGFLAVAALVGLAGCATPGGTLPSAEPVTASDESEGRKRARIRLELAAGYFEQGKTEIALDELKQVLQLDPTYSEAYNLRGLVYMRLNDLRLAEESFRRAVTLNPRDSNALHNYGWLQCRQSRWDESFRSFDQAMANPLYAERAKTLMAQGLCQVRAGRKAEAERSLARSLELDAANPVTGYNLANLLYQRGEFTRAQFYIRRLNNSEFANAETLWLGVKVENRMNDTVAMQQLGEQLKKRYPTSREAASWDRRAFND
jgi:type IV pilus assembly protein PilF